MTRDFGNMEHLVRPVSLMMRLIMSVKKKKGGLMMKKNKLKKGMR